MVKKITLSILVLSILVFSVWLYFSRQGKISTELSERSNQYLEQESIVSNTEIDNDCFSALVPFSLEYIKFNFDKNQCIYRATSIESKNKLTISFEKKELNNLEEFASVNMRLLDEKYIKFNLDLSLEKPYVLFKNNSELTAFVLYPEGVVTIAFYEFPNIDQDRLDIFKQIIKSFNLKLY